MNKKEFIAWVEALPEDFEVQPFEFSSMIEDETPWQPDYGSVGSVYRTVYTKKVTTNMKLDLIYKQDISGEFQRDQFGHEQWANVRRMK